MTLEERLHDGSRAKEILENEVFTKSFEAIEKEITEQWISSPARDAEGREKCWQYLMILKKVMANLVSTMESGKLAEIELNHKRTMLERLNPFA